MKKTKLLLAFILICQTLSAQTVVVIGTGTATQKQPFGMYYGYERSAAIYTTNLVTSSLITSLGWYVGTGKALNSPVKIYIKTTSSSTLSTTTWTAMKTGATLVYSGMLSFPSSGLQIIDIADYVLIGTKIIVMCETNFGGIGASTYPTFRYTNSTNAHEIWQGDDLATVNASTGTLSANRPNIQVTYVAAGSPIPPSGFMASASSSSQINLNWIRNTIPDNVMVAFNTTNTFGTPSGTYVAGNSITGGGTVIYNGSATTYSHNSGLSPATIYHYKAWSVNGGTPIYSVGTSASSATLCNSNTIYPFLTDFESTLFPPICWSYAGLSWARSSSASGYGTGNGSAMANFFTQVSGSFDLISPEINISALTDPIVKFDHAYATYNTQTDKLELWYSIDNGITFMLLTTYLGGISGPLNTGGTSTVAFVPTAGQWATKSYALPAGTNRVMFRGVSLNGNNLYLDNITFLGTCTGVLIPTAVITPGGPTTFCQGGSVALTASGGTYYLWSNAATTSAISVTTSGTYAVTVTNSSGCTDTESIAITVNSLPTAVITPDGPTTFCQGGSVLLTSSGGTGYLWSNSATAAAINVNSSGTYTVTVTNSSGCADSESTVITVNSLPTAVITPDGPTTFCQGSSVALTASGGTGYLWSNSATTAAINVNTSGTYTVTATNSSGCADTENIAITVNSLPTAVITPDGPTTFCQGGSVVLTASGGTSYLWSNAATTSVISVTTSGTYTVTVTNSSGCADSESTVITVNSLPSAVITPDGPTTFCQGGSVLLTASGGTSYLWSNAATTSVISVTTSGTYAVTVTNSGGCADSESTVITVNSLPIAVITPDGPTTFCQGGSVLLTASGGTSYLWSNAATTSEISVTTSGSYAVTITNSSGCTDTESTVVTVNPLPTAVIITDGPTTFCQGGSVALTASGGTSYLWSNAATTSAISVTTSGTYAVTVTNSSGCTDSESTAITVNSLPTAVITPDGPTTFCQSGSVVLTASGGTSYLWSNAATTSAILVTTSGTYAVTVTKSSGCTDTESTVITVNSLPTAVITPDGPTTFCQGGSVALTASGGTSYLWSNAATTSTISATTSGIYTVTVTNSSGCADTESTAITVNSLPTAVITPDGPITFCQGGSVVLTASGGTSYFWSNAATTSTISVTTSGIYTVTVTNSSGCTDTESIAITVNSLPIAVITPGGPTTFCQGGSVMLTASGGIGYLWSTSATTAAINVNSSGTYAVTVTNSTGCMDMESTVITVNSLPTAVITPDGPTTFCQGGSVVLTASGGSNYFWSNSATSAAINVNSSGNYTVTVTSSSGCEDSASTAITVNSLPIAVITPVGPTTFCQGGSVLLTASGGTAFLWSTAATTSAISVITSGTYAVTVTNSTGCMDMESTVITVNSLPIAVITPDGPTTFCQGGSVVLTASGGSNYLWSNSATSAAINVNSSGIYTVTVTNSSGCTDTESTDITVNSLPIAVITPVGPT